MKESTLFQILTMSLLLVLLGLTTFFSLTDKRLETLLSGLSFIFIGILSIPVTHILKESE